MLSEPRDSKLRVLIVDDSAVVRGFIQRVIESEPGFQVVGTARDGRIAIERCRELRPDVVTLDVEMPILDGLSALPALLETNRDLAVIMVSALTIRGARETVEALMRGAVDYVTKPSRIESREDATAQFSALLSPKLRALASRKRTSLELIRPLSARVSRTPSTPSRLTAGSELRVLAIGSSTGGPAALGHLLASLPRSFSLPIVIAQHMPEAFTRLLAERLSSVSPFLVRETLAGEALRAGEAWIAPGNFHMTVDKGVADELCLGVHSGVPVNCCRPSIDVLFESLSRSAGRETLAVVLTGMGHDGRDGASAIHRAGGQVIVQDQASSVVWGMPGAVVAAGAAHGVVSLRQMADEIAARVRVGRAPIRTGS